MCKGSWVVNWTCCQKESPYTSEDSKALQWFSYYVWYTENNLKQTSVPFKDMGVIQGQGKKESIESDHKMPKILPNM